MKQLKSIILGAAISASATFVYAGEPMQITTPVGFEALSADGRHLSEFAANTFTFSVGSFTNAFVPTNGNFTEWGANWITVVDTPWRISGPPAAANRINAFYNQTTPEATGLQGYVWGYDQQTDPTTAQWILLTNDAWVFPALNDTATDLLPENNWSIGSEGTYAIFGSVSADGMQLQAIPEPSTYALIFGLGILGFLGYRRVRK